MSATWARWRAAISYMVLRSIGVSAPLSLTADAIAERLPPRLMRWIEMRDGAEGMWFTQRERAQIRVLVAFIVPSDVSGPGALDAQVDEQLDRLIASSPSRQPIYRRGLAAFDRLAYRRFGKRILDLPQVKVLEVVDQITKQAPRGRSGRIGRVMRRVGSAWSGSGAARSFFQRLVKDTLEIFYSSAVAWAWLGYEGPPFPPQGDVEK